MTKHALGLPQSSVRAILAILLVSGFIAGCFIGVDSPILGMMLVLTTIVVKDYFEKDKHKQGGSDEKTQ